MVDILEKFISAERTGSWESHLSTLYEMLPFFAVAGHNLYLKSGYINLQPLLELPTTNPIVHQAVIQGNHVIRRSNRY